jgi:Restriction endonuclease
LLATLNELGDQQWYAYVPYDEGPVFESSVGGIAYQLADHHGVIDFFARVKRPDEGEELGTARDLVLPGAGVILQVDLSDINDELIRYLAKHPERMHNLTSRKFEELVAALFRAKGYDVELTPATRDGGFDMRAFNRTDIGTCLTLIECKRYAPTNRISVDVVRGLYGVTESEKATTGLLVTTSSFTRDAKSFQDKNKYRIQLADQQALQEWLREHNC